ncbi:hypothetical protein [Uliginosibacterium sp. H1]|uniref:hypothetical protein n=1 Tax=Uliginosibacterium sp. H1 TaxID=3114757 RepID=UPI002E19500F|nr:hypothetical protein [Uliginosibacterium sp. H1]
MPIVFEEVTGEIAPPPAPAGNSSPSASATGQADDDNALRHQLALLAERAQRLQVD